MYLLRNHQPQNQRRQTPNLRTSAHHILRQDPPILNRHILGVAILRNGKARPGLGDDAADDGEREAGDHHVDEDPVCAPALGDVLAEGRADGGPDVGGEHEEGEGVGGAVDVAEGVEDGAGDVGEAGGAEEAGEGHEGDEHGAGGGAEAALGEVSGGLFWVEEGTWWWGRRADSRKCEDWVGRIFTMQKQDHKKSEAT